MGGRAAAHRGRLRTAAGADLGAPDGTDRVAGRHPGQGLVTQLIGIGTYDLDGTRPRRARPGGPRGGRRRTHARPVAGRREASRRGRLPTTGSYTGVKVHERTLRTCGADGRRRPARPRRSSSAACSSAIAAELAAADFADLVIRRLAGPALTGPPSAGPPIPGLPLAGVETLLERAVECADVYAPPADRAAIRERVAGTVLELTEPNPGSVARGPTRNHGPPCPGERPAPVTTAGTIQEPAGNANIRGNSAAGPRQQALAAGFAASAHSASQLDLLRSWLSGDLLPDGLSLTADLRARVLFTLSARGLADDGNLDALAAADPVRRRAAPCHLPRHAPGLAGKEAAWQAALADDQDLQMAEAHARGLWVAGQEDLMAGATVTGTSPKRCRRWRTGNPERRAASRGCCTRPRSSHRPRSRPPTRRFRLGIPAGSFGSSSRSSRQSCVQHSRHGQLPGGSSCRDHRPMPDEQVPRDLING